MHTIRSESNDSILWLWLSFLRWGYFMIVRFVAFYALLAAWGGLLSSIADAQTPYVALEGMYSDTDVDSSGFNPLGPHQNTGSDSDASKAFSFAVGIDDLVTIAPGFEVRAELEGQRRSSSDYVTNSFRPPTPTFFYRTQAEAWTGFANAWLEWRVMSGVELFAGGGIGFARHDVETDDNVVSGSKSSTEFAWQAGGGINVDLNRSLELTAGVRYVDLGESSTPMFGITGLSGGPLVLDHTSIDYRLGLRFKFGQGATP